MRSSVSNRRIVRNRQKRAWLHSLIVASLWSTSALAVEPAPVMVHPVMVHQGLQSTYTENCTPCVPLFNSGLPAQTPQSGRLQPGVPPVSGGNYVPGSSPSNDAASNAFSDATQFAPPSIAAPSAAAIAAADASGLGGTGRSQSLASTTGSRGGLDAPNMIGDLFNAGTSSAVIHTTVEFNMNFGGVEPSYTGSAQTFDLGLLPSISDQTIDGVFGIFDANAAGNIWTSDLNATRLITLDGTPDPGNPLELENPVAPTSNSAIYADLNAYLASQSSNDLIGVSDAQDFIDIVYLPDSSKIKLDGTGTMIQSADYQNDVRLRIPVPSPGEVVGRYSIAENNSPLPRDRVFLDYNFFHRARLSAVALPVSRWAPGFEKTFLDRQMSVEFRAPMAVTLSSDIDFNRTDLIKYEFGDVSMSFKALLLQTRTTVLACGLGITLPTADDFYLRDKLSQPLIHVKNESVHLVPYLAGLHRPNDRVYIQSFAQIDVDTNGNPVFLNEQFVDDGFDLVNQGRLRGQTVGRLSVGAGGLLFQRPNRRLSAMAATLEAHYTSTLDRSGSVGSKTLAVGDPTRSLDVLNLTMGQHSYVGKSVFTTAYGVPVTRDRVFDGELRVLINRYF